MRILGNLKRREMTYAGLSKGLSTKNMGGGAWSFRADPSCGGEDDIRKPKQL